MTLKIFVTGANGFLGRALCASLPKCRFAVTGLSRNQVDFPDGVESLVGDLTSLGEDWQSALVGCDAVVHCAARVHIMTDTAENPAAEFHRINVAATLHLAKLAASAGVKRFVFISSIKVNGEQTLPGRAFFADDLPKPEDAYATSKWHAEQGLIALSKTTRMEVVIIRPPLIYGSGVKANFAALIKLVKSRIPLPLGAIHNKRSFVFLDNLVHFITLCVEHPLAANQTFLVSDGQDVSTTDLLRYIGNASGRRIRLIPLPEILLKIAATILGRQAMAKRLCESLQVDIQKNHELLGWKPPFTLSEGLAKTMGEIGQ